MERGTLSNLTQRIREAPSVAHVLAIVNEFMQTLPVTTRASLPVECAIRTLRTAEDLHGYAYDLRVCRPPQASLRDTFQDQLAALMSCAAARVSELASWKKARAASR